MTAAKTRATAPTNSPADDEADSTKPLTAVERATDVLVYLARIRRQDFGVSEIARDLDRPKAMVHRILTSLRSSGLVVMDENTHRYSLGPTSLLLGLSYLNNIDVRQLASAQLRGLSDATGETATLSVRAGQTRVYIEQATPDRDVIMSVRIGVPFPLHAGSSSIAFLAFMSDVEIDAYLSGPLEKTAASTIVDKRKLRREVLVVRERGWAESSVSRDADRQTVAAPILDHMGVPQAVMSVCGPASRFPAVKELAIERLLETTARVSAQLGHSIGRA